jgi:hypothetical protein
VVLKPLQVVDFAFGGLWRNGIKKPEQLPPHVPAFFMDPIT